MENEIVSSIFRLMCGHEASSGWVDGGSPVRQEPLCQGCLLPVGGDSSLRVETTRPQVYFREWGLGQLLVLEKSPLTKAVSHHLFF